MCLIKLFWQNERSGYLIKDERYSLRAYEITYDYYGELKLTVLADCMCEAVSVANSCIRRVLGFVPKKLFIKEIKKKGISK